MHSPTSLTSGAQEENYKLSVRSNERPKSPTLRSSVPFDDVKLIYFPASHVYHSCKLGVNDSDMALE